MFGCMFEHTDSKKRVNIHARLCINGKTITKLVYSEGDGPFTILFCSFVELLTETVCCIEWPTDGRQHCLELHYYASLYL